MKERTNVFSSSNLRSSLVAIAITITITAAPACGGSNVSATATSTPGSGAGLDSSRATETRQGDVSPSSSSSATTTPQLATSTTTTSPPEDPPQESVNARSSGAAKAEADLPKKISARHVLIQWMGADKAASSIVRSRDQALAVAKLVLKRAKAGDDFARLAIEFSDEPGAGNRGGSLGRFGRGQMVPAFDQAAFRLDVNQVSEIIETPFGFHVIQRTE